MLVSGSRIAKKLGRCQKNRLGTVATLPGKKITLPIRPEFLLVGKLSLSAQQAGAAHFQDRRFPQSSSAIVMAGVTGLVAHQEIAFGRRLIEAMLGVQQNRPKKGVSVGALAFA